MASSHLLQENEEEYNFGFAEEELGQLSAVINFCRREQGIIIAKGNSKRQRMYDLGDVPKVPSDTPHNTHRSSHCPSRKKSNFCVKALDRGFKRRSDHSRRLY
ncbi:MAG: hypothetical protein JRC88_04950 [Deltaproteobacteria bacterium]|nr:hypothetical protein [Deltaproteobacteria bacterium]